MSILEDIQKLHLFSVVSLELLKKVSITSKHKKFFYNKGSIIHMQDEYCTKLDTIIAGIVSVVNLEPSGNTMTIANFRNGENIGINLLFTSNPKYPMTVIAKTDVEIISFDKEVLLEICMEEPKFLTLFLQEISEKALVLSGKINTIAFKSIRERIVEFLILEQAKQNRDTIILPFSKKEWAELIGVERPSLSRELNKMRSEGMIEYHNRKIKIVDIHIDI